MSRRVLYNAIEREVAFAEQRITDALQKVVFDVQSMAGRNLSVQTVAQTSLDRLKSALDYHRETIDVRAAQRTAPHPFDEGRQYEAQRTAMKAALDD